MSTTQVIEIDLAYESGLRLKDSYQLMSKQVSGSDNLDFTKQDHKNYLCNKRQRALEFGEATSLERYFHNQLKKKKKKKNLSYYYAFQLDVEELITNIFWANAGMVIDYSHFGDVVTFDTTYSTNKDVRPLDLFLGLNNVWKKKSITIFTDQDVAMSAALQIVMLEMYHALCSWHMWQNANRHLGYLLKSGSRFNKDFLACVYKYNDEDDFLFIWNIMLEKYDAHENKWLIDIFKLKKKWVQVYVIRTFTAGIKSTQLNKRFNCDSKDCLPIDLSILEFFTNFERVIKQKCDKELKAEYNSRQKLPRLNLKNLPMLNQVAKVYTSKIFELFQNEVEEVPPLSIIDYTESQETHRYVVGVFNEHGKYNIMWNPSDQTLSCNCRKFETSSILCRYALKILDVWDIKLILDRYILKRWRRDAKYANEKQFLKNDIVLDTRL
jgi:zinc finger SWIM domain-containing protein 3